MEVILDTNVLSILQAGRTPIRDRVENRLLREPNSLVFATIVSFQEQTRGWLASVNHSKSDSQLLLAYAELQKLLENYRKLQVLPFEDQSLATFHDLRRQRVRIGTRDLRIAAIALARGAKVITQNFRDFEKVPGLLVEDWTV